MRIAEPAEQLPVGCDARLGVRKAAILFHVGIAEAAAQRRPGNRLARGGRGKVGTVGRLPDEILSRQRQVTVATEAEALPGVDRRHWLAGHVVTVARGLDVGVIKAVGQAYR